MTGRPKRIGSRDIAAAAGVSQSTVSRVLNNSPSISAATYARVQEAMAALGYTPNAAARTLITGRSSLIGLVISNIANPFYPAVVDSVVDEAARHQFNVILSSSHEDPDLQLSGLRLLAEHQVDGVVLASALAGSEAGLREFGKRGKPLVLLNREVPGIDASHVVLDNVQAGKMATEHLLALGHKRIGFLGGKPSASTSSHRREGFLYALRRAHVRPTRAHISDGEFTYDSGYSRALALFTTSVRPTALVCADDTIALGAIDAALDLGMYVPDDIAVVGFDDIPAASLRSIGLTTVRSPAAEMGRLAVQAVIARLRDENAERTRVVLRPELVVRRTCGNSARIPHP